MAHVYKHASTLAKRISARRIERKLTLEKVGTLSGVDVSQVFRICRGEFKTLNPSVLKICKILALRPEVEDEVPDPSDAKAIEAKLSAEVLTAWDRTEAGASLLIRVLRALHRDD